MMCEHIKQLFQLCEEHDLKLSSSDIIRISCQECQRIEVCPATLADEYESREAQPHSLDNQDGTGLG